MAKIIIKNRDENSGNATQISPRQKRGFCILANDSNVDIFYGFNAGVTANSADSAGIRLAPGQREFFPDLPSAAGGNDFAIYAVHDEPDNTDPEVRFIER